MWVVRRRVAATWLVSVLRAWRSASLSEQGKMLMDDLVADTVQAGDTVIYDEATREQLLGVTGVTIQKYIRQGRIAARKRGVRNWLINLDELRRFAESNNMYFDAELAQELTQQ